MQMLKNRSTKIFGKVLPKVYMLKPLRKLESNLGQTSEINKKKKNKKKKKKSSSVSATYGSQTNSFSILDKLTVKLVS